MHVTVMILCPQARAIQRAVLSRDAFLNKILGRAAEAFLYTAGRFVQ